MFNLGRLYRQGKPIHPDMPPTQAPWKSSPGFSRLLCQSQAPTHSRSLPQWDLLASVEAGPALTKMRARSPFEKHLASSQVAILAWSVDSAHSAHRTMGCNPLQTQAEARFNLQVTGGQATQHDEFEELVDASTFAVYCPLIKSLGQPAYQLCILRIASGMARGLQLGLPVNAVGNVSSLLSVTELSVIVQARAQIAGLADFGALHSSWLWCLAGVG